MPTFRLTIAYDGNDFLGWQRQPGKRTVQGELETTFARVTRQSVKCVASGRTDAGVHALGQVVGVTVDTWLRGEALVKALNCEGPEDIMVFDATVVHDTFHAIREATRKRYRYIIENGQVRDVFARNHLWHVFRKLDIDAMRRAAQGLVGTHDFKSYQTTGSMRMTTVRTVYEISVERVQYDLTERIVIEVEADGFLYNMVRSIVGTLVDVGKGTRSESNPVEMLSHRCRTKTGMTAPAQGLYLLKVWYDDVHPHADNPDAEEEESPDVATEVAAE